MNGKRTKSIVVSPVGERKNLFLNVENYIREYFTKAIFLPYSIDITRLKDLTVHYLDTKDCEIGQAFFHKFTPTNKPENIIGDVN